MPVDPAPSCFVCQRADPAFLFEKGGRRFWRCPDCGMQKQHPLPTPGELAAFYESSYGAGMYAEFAAAAQLKELTAQRRLREIQGRVPLEGRWLDVGASTGAFSQAVAARGIQAEGVELSETAVESARSAGVTMHLGDLADLPTDPPYDVVTAFDLIEHVLDPPGFLLEVHRRLAEGGWLVLTLPDLGAWQRFLMGKRWYFYIPEEHLHYFSRRAMRRFLRGHGFEPGWVGATYKPMTFDYAQTQFREYNPGVHAVLRMLGAPLPRAWRQWPAPLPIGEMMAIARRKPNDG